jgi:CheY-like chemotaxis protein
VTHQTSVLVVEDDPLLRIAAADMVESAGFSVLEAANATEAVGILESRLDIHIVFSDIDMPAGINGIMLAAVIRDRWPPIEIILVSGHVDAPDIDLPARTVFFSKPYDEKKVVAAIRKFAA